MPELISVVVALVLLIGFFMLVRHETARGVRFFGLQRARLDEIVLQAEYVFTHVDLGAFIESEVSAFAHRVGHDTVHFTLRVVRLAERLLTRIVRWLRTRSIDEEAPRETTREFVRTLSDFKDTLEATHPEVREADEAPKDRKPGSIG